MTKLEQVYKLILRHKVVNSKDMEQMSRKHEIATLPPRPHGVSRNVVEQQNTLDAFM